jgi:hypothetical protein
MPNIDDFIRPKEWVSDFVTELGKVLITEIGDSCH